MQRKPIFPAIFFFFFLVGGIVYIISPFFLYKKLRRSLELFIGERVSEISLRETNHRFLFFFYGCANRRFSLHCLLFAININYCQPIYLLLSLSLFFFFFFSFFVLELTQAPIRPACDAVKSFREV